MPTKTVDRRIERTRQLLQEALIAVILEKGFEAATVQDVIDRANVGRSTFYAHFQDKEDLLLSGFEHLRAEFEKHLLSASVTSTSPWELSLSMFQHAEGQRQLYKALAGKQGGNVVITYIQKYLATYLSEHLKQQLKKRKNPFPYEILFVLKVSVKRGASHVGAVDHILHGGGFKSFFQNDGDQSFLQ